MSNRNCPNCGAALDLHSCQCPYCGTPYYDLSVVPAGKPFYMTVNNDGRTFTVRAYLRSVSIEPQINTPVTVDIEIGGFLINTRYAR